MVEKVNWKGFKKQVQQFLDLVVAGMQDDALHKEVSTEPENRVGLSEAEEQFRNNPPKIAFEDAIIVSSLDKVSALEGESSEKRVRAIEDAPIIETARIKTELLKKTPSYQRAVELKQEKTWAEMEQITVENAIKVWLETISNERTKKAYKTSLSELIKWGFVLSFQSLQQFALRNHNVTLDLIKTGQLPPITNAFTDEEKFLSWSECTKQQRAAAFLSFTGFLERRTGGIVKKAVPNKENIGKTFFRVRSQVKTNAIHDTKTRRKFFKELDKINSRDGMIAKIMLQGGKRISEVLSLETDMIDFEKKSISFRQSKTRGVEQVTIISFERSPEFLQSLKQYIGDRTGLVFVTSTGKRIAPQQIERNFEKAGVRADISFKVTPHVMRTTAVTIYKREGFSDSDVMKVTGHSSSEMVRMYDKSDLADNASRGLSLI